ncbi:cellulose biosynthesis protein BcsS [Rhodopseudomonas telluris]|uniref:Cellulose biosynthesis protein BcsS n=1 Tax=Rhodopseudomonas telluris TaxID=644215 RepID=A0ABV6ET90_9BRAD
MAAVVTAGAFGAIAQTTPADLPNMDRNVAQLAGENDAVPSEPDDFDSGDFPTTGLEASLEAELGAGLGAGLATGLKSGLGTGQATDHGDNTFGAAADANAMAMLTPFPSSAPALSGGSTADQVLLFGGYDIWSNGHSASAGLHWAQNGLNQDGFVVRLMLSNGTEFYRTPNRLYTTDIFRAAIMPGVRFKTGEFELKLFAGPDLEQHNLTPDNPTSKWRGAHPGLRMAAEIWAQPMPELMLAASVYATTIAAGYGFRAAAGWRVADAVWIGPEWSGSCDELSRQTRWGLHVTGWPTGPLEWSGAVGFVSDSFGRNGAYTRLATQLRL